MKHLRLYSLLLLCLLHHPALAEKEFSFKSSTAQTTLVELYTSQGCSSCPPAEHWLNSLIDHPGLWDSIIPMAFHVDYWDYIGWKDPFAKAEFSQRQRKYQQTGAVSSVYTPGFLVNGKGWRGWFNHQPLPKTEKQAGTLALKISNDNVEATFQPVGTTKEPLELNIAILGFDLHTEVNAGENKGKKLAQEFVVLHHQVSKPHTTKWKLKLTGMPTDKPKRRALIGWISPANNQQPIQATGGWWH